VSEAAARLRERPVERPGAFFHRLPVSASCVRIPRMRPPRLPQDHLRRCRAHLQPPVTGLFPFNPVAPAQAHLGRERLGPEPAFRTHPHQAGRREIVSELRHPGLLLPAIRARRREDPPLHQHPNPQPGSAIDIFRMGYYGGEGARLMTTLGPFTGKEQPVPEIGPQRLRECQWTASTTLTIRPHWPSGVVSGRPRLLPRPGTRKGEPGTLLAELPRLHRHR